MNRDAPVFGEAMTGWLLAGITSDGGRLWTAPPGTPEPEGPPMTTRHLPAWASTGWTHAQAGVPLPWPVIRPPDTPGVTATAHWALGELARLGVTVHARLTGPVLEILSDVYELGTDDG